ncbi:UNVERIFIED_CONTAM: hypothetical protein Sradi_4760600 [Sesamum radiatum]|uniref:RNA polymerase I-specific transcription initiation factor RRN3 n=1 Tax=Sesamum radiatum TaxID=300843 RepID=A0AAW2MY98_SESRA
MGVPDMDELSFTDSELDYHVRNALKAVVQGDCDFYNQLVAVIHHKERLVAEEVALLVTCLKAVTGAVSSIHIAHHRSLLAAIFGMSLWDYGTDVMDALVELLVSLASSSGEYVDLCLEMLVGNFIPPSAPPSASYFVELLKQPRGLAKKNQVLDRVHSTLKDIASVVPLSPLRLEKIVRDRMPNIYTKEPFIVMYVENMLRLESGVMGELVGSTILVALVDRLIDLDLTREALIQRFFSGNLVAEKLDSLMVLTFEHLRSCAESGRLVQFVMFYACSLDPENCGKMFADLLLNIFVSSLNPEWRMSAVSYIASYLARAKFVPVSFVASMLERPRGRRESCKQATMYVLCFRMRQMLAIPRLKSQLCLMRIEDILGHPLKPLQVCLPSIVEEFLRLVKANHVFSLPQSFVEYGMLESDNSRAFGGMERFDMFFPFDPCLLRKCDSYVRPNYVYWSMVRSTYDEDDGEGTSEEDVEEAYASRNGMSIPDDGSRRSYDDEVNSDADEFDYSLDKMSITPRDSSNKFGGRMQRFMQMPSKIRPSASPESL